MISQSNNTESTNNQSSWTPNDNLHLKTDSFLAPEAISTNLSRTTFKAVTVNQYDTTEGINPETSVKAQRRPNTTKQFNFTVHSKPGSRKVKVDCKTSEQLGVRIAITDLLGKELLSGIRYFLKGNNELEFNVSHLAQGQYLVSMEHDDHVITRKLDLMAQNTRP